MAPRVQVGDLSAPEQIRPAGYQSDTFAQAAQAPINRDAERLADALGTFRTGVLQLHAGMKADQAKNEADWKKAQTDRRTIEFNQYVATTPEQEILADIKRGQAPYYADPFIGSLARKFYTQKMLKDFASEVDADIAEGKIPLGRPDFNPERYVLEKARGRAEIFSNSPEEASGFASGLAEIRDDLKKKHQGVVGKAVTDGLEQMAWTNFADGIANGIDSKLPPDLLYAQIRRMYKELGPRSQGGSADIAYSRLDEILLNVLEAKAKDPKQAEVTRQILEMPRVSVDGDNTRLGSFSQTLKHSDKSRAIFDSATKTLVDNEKLTTERAIAEQDKAALMRRDGSFNVITNYSDANRWDVSKKIEISAEKRKENAVMAVIKDMRAANKGLPDIPNEIDIMAVHGVKHPELIPMLEGAFAGGMVTARPNGALGPGEVERIVQGAQVYETIAQHSKNYLQAHLDAKTFQFYQTYEVFRASKLPPEQAAIAAARAFAPEADRDLSGFRQEIESAAKSLDSSPWIPFTGEVANRGAVEGQIRDLATRLRAGGLSAEKAVQAAKETISSNVFYVNNMAVYGAKGIEKTDVPHVTAILDAEYKKNEAYFKQQGLSSSEISIVPYGGNFVVVNTKTLLPIAVPRTDKEGKIIGTYVPKISIEQVGKVRAAAKERADAENRANVLDMREMYKNAPHNLIRRGLGLAPN